jgi:gamma-glutamylputrescine oxidase
VAGAAAINAVSPIILPEKMIFEANRSYWARALPAANAPLEQDLEAAVGVVGGGFTGLSAAYYLKKNVPKERVVLLEAERCGNGASGRNGAMMLTMTDDRYMEWSGDPALDRKIYNLTTENIAKLKELSASLGVDAEIEQNGALQVCNTPGIAEHGRRFVDKARAAGFPFEYWDIEKLRAVIGTQRYAGALFDPNSGQLHPGKLVRLMKAAAESAGVEIYDKTPVTLLEEGEKITLTTADGRQIRARSVVLATNAYTSKLGYLRGAASPLVEYVAITAPLSEQLLSEIGWTRRIPFNDSRTEVFYLGLTKYNRIHIGGGHADYEFNNGLQRPATATQRFAELRSELARIYPKLAAVPFETTWSGIVDYSLDGSPAVGQLGKYGNIFYAIGFSGHGVNLTSIFGRIIADLARGKSQQWSWLPYLNKLPPYTPNEPFRWVGVQLAKGLYRLTDPN